jgi:predicted RNase H-like HicB family nuclease
VSTAPLDMPGCIAQAEALPEAVSRLKAILPAYKQALIARGVKIPDAKPAPAVSVRFVSFRDLHHTTG